MSGAHADPDTGARVGHVGYTDVDDLNVAYWSCRYPSGALCGQAEIRGKVSAEQAAIIRQERDRLLAGARS